MTRNHPLEQRLLPSQAGVFGDRFQLFIPKYPQANLAVFAMPDPLAREVLEIATGELLRAFDHFLEELGQRPFILAGHSQGAYHAVAILARRIAGTPLQNQLVAVYAPGYFIPAATFTEIGIPLCTDQAGTGCVQLWNAVSDKHRLPPGIHNMPQPVGPRPLQRKNPSFACTNPLDPSRDYVPAAENKGARVGNIFGLQEQMRSGLVGARCIEGKLIIDRPSRLRYRWAQMAPGWFHLYEFSYFFANIRADAHRRLEAWQRRQNS